MDCFKAKRGRPRKNPLTKPKKPKKTVTEAQIFKMIQEWSKKKAKMTKAKKPRVKKPKKEVKHEEPILAIGEILPVDENPILAHVNPIFADGEILPVDRVKREIKENPNLEKPTIYYLMKLENGEWSSKKMTGSIIEHVKKYCSA